MSALPVGWAGCGIAEAAGASRPWWAEGLPGCIALVGRSHRSSTDEAHAPRQKHSRGPCPASAWGLTSLARVGICGLGVAAWQGAQWAPRQVGPDPTARGMACRALLEFTDGRCKNVFIRLSAGVMPKIAATQVDWGGHRAKLRGVKLLVAASTCMVIPVCRWAKLGQA
jgi:hypothetical protein